MLTSFNKADRSASSVVVVSHRSQHVEARLTLITVDAVLRNHTMGWISVMSSSGELCSTWIGVLVIL